MLTSDIFLLLVIIILLLVLGMFISEKEKNKRSDRIIEILTKENKRLKQAYLSLLEKYLLKIENFPPDSIVELQRLKAKTDHLDKDVHYELDTVISLVNSGHGVKAVRDLAKIVENKLKEKAENDSDFKKKPTLSNLLDFAHHSKWIKQRHFENGQLLREIRNQESHELAVKLDSLQIGLAIFSGIEILYSIA